VIISDEDLRALALLDSDDTEDTGDSEDTESIEEDMQLRQARKVRAVAASRPEHLWVVHKQIKINDADLHLDEGVVTKRSNLNHGMSVAGFYSSVASCNAACRAAFFRYMRNKFNWNEEEVMSNINKHVDEPPIRSKDGTHLYYWEGRVVWRHWVKVNSEDTDDYEDGDEIECETEAYAVISFSPFMVEITP